MKTARNGSWAPGRSLLAARWVTDERITRADGKHFFFGSGGNAFRCSFVSYRAVDRAEYWRLVAATGRPRYPDQDDDGLIPGEDDRHALTLLGGAPDGWAPCSGSMEIVFPASGAPKLPRLYVVTAGRGANWPNAMNPGEWRPFTG